MIYVYNKAEPKGLEFIEYPDTSFEYCYNEDWFKSNFAKKVFDKVEKCEYLGDGIFKSRVDGRKFIYSKLSTGTKTLLMLYNLDGYYFYSNKLGDNCWELLKEFQDEKDIHFKLNWIPIDIEGGLHVFYVDIGREVVSSEDVFLSTIDMMED